jgi:hypothetical protein
VGVCTTVSFTGGEVLAAKVGVARERGRGRIDGSAFQFLMPVSELRRPPQAISKSPGSVGAMQEWVRVRNAVTHEWNSYDEARKG